MSKPLPKFQLDNKIKLRFYSDIINSWMYLINHDWISENYVELYLKKEAIIIKLINKGNSIERAREILAEAESSSNPEYIYSNYKIKIS